jgi:hypothetical protein
MSELQGGHAIAEKDPPGKPSDAPHPGSKQMPRWDVGKLVDPPAFSWRKWPSMLGPGLVMGAAAIGGGEWLTGPVVTAQYGGAVLWLAALSIFGQTVYNVEISRYTLYCGEPIFTGKFRTLPGPIFWLAAYLMLDIGSFLPYLASNAAIPLASILQGEIVSPKENPGLIKGLAVALFLLAITPLFVGGKVYNSMKAIMTFKLIFVFGFLLFLAIFFSSFSTWVEIVTGFFKFGTLPVKDTTAAADADAAAAPAAIPGAGAAASAEQPAPKPPKTANVFVEVFSGRGFPTLDLTLIGFLAAMAAISGNGGLTNTPISNYTRDQGWGMGKQVGAIPSILGGHAIELSHVGKVFHVTPDSLPRWKGWLRHVQREQWMIWMPACLLGIALPSMLSIQFLPRGGAPSDKWMAAGMTAGGVSEAVGPTFGGLFWYLTLFCGLLVLGTSSVATADGVLRRWVDVSWTALPALRKWRTDAIGRYYFGVLIVYATFGVTMLILVKGDNLVVWSTMIYNYALGFSCWHTIFVNSILLPKELRPSLLRRGILLLAGLFFTSIAVITTIVELKRMEIL